MSEAEGYKARLEKIAAGRNKFLESYFANRDGAISLIYKLHIMFQEIVPELFKNIGRKITILEAERVSAPYVLMIEISYQGYIELVFDYKIEFNKDTISVAFYGETDSRPRELLYEIKIDSSDANNYDMNKLIEPMMKMYGANFE